MSTFEKLKTKGSAKGLIDRMAELYDMAGSGLSARAEIEILYKAAYNNKYREFTYTDGNITEIKVWDGAAKTNLLFTKTITYNLSGDITTIVIMDHIASKSLTKTITYEVNGDLDAISEVYA